MIRRNNNIAWLEFKNLSLYRTELLHFSTLRFGGISAHPQASLNLGFTDSDSVENVLHNRILLASSLEISFNQFVFSHQTHSSNIHIITENDKGKGVFTKTNAITNNDGYIVTTKNICVCVLTADCTPVFFYDPLKKIAAIVHSGWRGTVKKVSAKVIQKMKDLGCKPNNILVGIGPSIKACCYEVKEDVLSAFKQSFVKNYKDFFNKSFNSYKLDMSKAIINQLVEQGVVESNIETSTLCTHCNPFMFFSARNSMRGLTGRMTSGIMIK